MTRQEALDAVVEAATEYALAFDKGITWKAEREAVRTAAIDYALAELEALVEEIAGCWCGQERIQKHIAELKAEGTSGTAKANASTES